MSNWDDYGLLTTLADGDTALVHDVSETAVGGKMKRITWGSIKTLLGALYASITAPIKETSGPTTLTTGAIADGEYLKRDGTTLIGGTPAGGGGLTYAAIAPTTANITLTQDYEYTVDSSGLTANRNLVLPAPSAAGKHIKLTMNVGDDPYYCVLIGDTGVTVNGGSAATEFMRFRVAGQSIEFVSTSTTNWRAILPPRFLIDKKVLTGTAASVEFANLTQAFTNLELQICARTDRASAGDGIKFTFNSDTGANYYSLRPSITHSATLTTAEQLGTNSMTVVTITGDSAPANSFGVGLATIMCYTSSKIKAMRAYGYALIGTATAGQYQRDGNGTWNSTSAVTSIQIIPETGPNFLAACEFILYGIL